MAKRYFHSQIDGYRVKFTHEANYTNYTAFINGLATTVYAKSLPEISGKVRKVIAAHAASLEVRHNTGQPAEVEIVNGQLERNLGAFTTDHPEDLCDDAKCGCHDDCDRRDCETCFDYAMGRAESAAEGMER